MNKVLGVGRSEASEALTWSPRVVTEIKTKEVNQMFKHVLVVMSVAAMALTGAAAFAADPDPGKPDPCKDLTEAMKQAANHLGHGDLGDAAEKAGEAAGAAVECAKEKLSASKTTKCTARFPVDKRFRRLPC